MTLYHEIEAECGRTENSHDTAENAKLGLTFRAVWWRQIKQELANQATENARMRDDLSQALRQWRMYAEASEDTDLEHDDSAEALLYRQLISRT